MQAKYSIESDEAKQKTAEKVEPVLFCWSGGKDSAMALHALRQQRDFRVAALLTTVTEGYERVSMHGVRRALLLRQAQSIGLPLQEVRIPPQCVNPIYEARVREALLLQKENGVCCVAFGDIFLQDLREYRERNLAQVEMKAIFPIWKRDTGELAQEFCATGFRSVAVCIDSKKLSREFAGREVDESFFRDLPTDVDPCGENGEFHTFVYDGPIFSKAIAIERGEIVERDGFYFCDVKETLQ
jgi:uncharacterized protein (TIGR00290 family)